MKLEERKNKFMTERLLECSRKTMNKAQTYADSILRIESKSQKFDSIPVPYDTLKPDKPSITFPPYQKPKSLLYDSLNQ